MIAGMPLMVLISSSKRLAALEASRCCATLICFSIAFWCSSSDSIFFSSSCTGEFTLPASDLMSCHFVGGFAIGFEAGNGFNAPDPGGNRVLTHDAEQANLARRARVRAAAKFHRITVQLAPLTADLQHADGVAVFLAEELHHVLALFHVGIRNFQSTLHRRILDDAFIDQFLDIGDLRRCERCTVKIECQFVRANE